MAMSSGTSMILLVLERAAEVAGSCAFVGRKARGAMLGGPVRYGMLELCAKEILGPDSVEAKNVATRSEAGPAACSTLNRWNMTPRARPKPRAAGTTPPPP
jgi:hypothetical protein